MLARLVNAPVAIALIVGAAALGLTTPVNFTFPWSELGRPRPEAWEAYTWAAATIGLAAVPHGRGALSLVRRALHATVLLAATSALAWALFTPTKWTMQVLRAPTAGAVTTPTMDGEVEWARTLMEGTPVALLEAQRANETALAQLAGGMHQAEAAGGMLDGLHRAVRKALWTAQEAAVAIALYGRVALLGLLPIATVLALTGGVPTPVVWAIRVPIWAIPATNALSVVLSTLVWMPDDLALRAYGALLAAVQLGVVLFADRAGRRST